MSTYERRDPSNPCRYLGAEDAVGIAIIDLADVPQPDAPGEPIIGIEIQRIEPNADDKDGVSGYLGYAPMWKDDSPEGYEIDDIHTDLPALCRRYGISLDLVIDRMAIALLRSKV